MKVDPHAVLVHFDATAGFHFQLRASVTAAATVAPDLQPLPGKLVEIHRQRFAPAVRHKGDPAAVVDREGAPVVVGVQCFKGETFEVYGQLPVVVDPQPAAGVDVEGAPFFGGRESVTRQLFRVHFDGLAVVPRTGFVGSLQPAADEGCRIDVHAVFVHDDVTPRHHLQLDGRTPRTTATFIFPRQTVARLDGEIVFRHENDVARVRVVPVPDGEIPIPPNQVVPVRVLHFGVAERLPRRTVVSLGGAVVAALVVRAFRQNKDVAHLTRTATTDSAPGFTVTQTNHPL